MNESITILNNIKTIIIALKNKTTTIIILILIIIINSRNAETLKINF